MIRLFFFSLILISALSAFCQEEINGTVVLVNQVPKDPERYDDIKKSPYLFDGFVNATMTDMNRVVTENVLLNYNGYTKMFECLYNDQVYDVEKMYYVKFDFFSPSLNPDLSSEMSDTTSFIRAINPNNFDEFYIRVFGGNEVTVIKAFEVNVINNKIQNVNHTLDMKFFNPKFNYWIIKDGQLSNLKLNKKTVLAALEGGKKVTNYVKENKLNLNTEKELVQVVSYYESLFDY